MRRKLRKREGGAVIKKGSKVEMRTNSWNLNAEDFFGILMLRKLRKRGGGWDGDQEGFRGVAMSKNVTKDDRSIRIVMKDVITCN